VCIAANVAVRHYHSNFTSNTAETSGGAVYLEPYSRAAMYASVFSNNGDEMTLSGGAIAVIYYLQLDIDSCTFNGNTAVSGGAVYSNIGSITVLNSTFTNCTASNSGNGGALWTANDATVSNTLFQQNAANQGSGMYISTATAVTNLVSNTFVNNTAQQAGAGVFQFTAVAPTAVVASSNTFANNTVNCCYALGHGSTSDWQIGYTSRSCADYDTGTGRQCCVVDGYIVNGTCLRCTEEFNCTIAGTTVKTLPLPTDIGVKQLHN
jgi:predicted outer membrane repeat protein